MGFRNLLEIQRLGNIFLASGGVLFQLKLTYYNRVTNLKYQYMKYAMLYQQLKLNFKLYSTKLFSIMLSANNYRIARIENKLHFKYKQKLIKKVYVSINWPGIPMLPNVKEL